MVLAVIVEEELLAHHVADIYVGVAPLVRADMDVNIVYISVKLMIKGLTVTGKSSRTVTGKSSSV